MKQFVFCLAILLCAILSPSTSSAENIFSKDENYNDITPEGPTNFWRADYFSLARKVLDTWDTADIEKLRDMALQDNFSALAALALVTRLRNDQMNVPPSFFEDWLYRELGEQEGGYLLGSLAGVISKLYTREDYSQELERLTVENLRRAAEAGHAEAMYGLMLYASRFPDPDFRMPDKPDFPMATQRMVKIPTTPEQFYWLGKAAASGSYRASLLMGSYFISPEARSLRNTSIGVEFMKKAASQGSIVGASVLEVYLDPRRIDSALPEANCRLALYYTTLFERMRDDDGLLGREKNGISRKIPPSRKWVQCLSEEEYFATLEDSMVEYSAIRAKLLARKHAVASQYERARTRLPQLWEAYEKAVTSSKSVERKAGHSSLSGGSGPVSAQWSLARRASL